MGNGFSVSLLCCSRPARAANGHHSIVEPWPSDDEAMGHSFRYRRGSPQRARSSAAASPPQGQPPAIPAFRAISGAAVSANSASRPVLRLRPRHPDQDSSSAAASPAPSNPAGFEGSTSFAAAPLQLSASAIAGASSGPLDRGLYFLSGPIERGALSGPLDGGGSGFSGPLSSKNRKKRRRRRGFPGSDSAVLLRAPFFLRRSSSERKNHRPWVVPLRGQPRPRVQWAHGKAGEDRVHVVVSEENRWLFVGIYDGFNGPDAPEFLAANLYRAVFDQLEGLFWEEEEEEHEGEKEQIQEAAARALALVEEDGEYGANRRVPSAEEPRIRKPLREFLADEEDDGSRTALCSVSDRFVFPLSKLRGGMGNWRRESHKIHFSHWRYGEEGREKVTGEAASRGRRRRWKTGAVADHGLVLGALSRALEITELAFLEMTDREIGRNPELALMGSCLLAVLVREDDVYVMNVGDSRAIVAQCRAPVGASGGMEDTQNCGGDDIAESPCRGAEEAEDQEMAPAMELVALQLSTDHSTSIEEEVLRIKEEHPDDSKCIVNNRVKGRLKVTRAFGAGFLKQPKWNNGLIEMFRNEYIGVAPYISCSPSLRHHKLGQNDQFLVLSSDGLYQYLTNEEVVTHVQNFMERFPDGDPAQSLIEELLFRAASNAGMDFFELLDIPQGDRRKYHDDVTVMVISLEGRTSLSSK